MQVANLIKFSTLGSCNNATYALTSRAFATSPLSRLIRRSALNQICASQLTIPYAFSLNSNLQYAAGKANLASESSSNPKSCLSAACGSALPFLSQRVHL